MNTEAKDFLHRLLDTPSPTGFEIEGQKVWSNYVKKFADTVENDAYGNTWARLKGRSDFSIMLEAHSDEIGFMVQNISDDGFLYLNRIGGSDPTIARNAALYFSGKCFTWPARLQAT